MPVVCYCTFPHIGFIIAVNLISLVPCGDCTQHSAALEKEADDIQSAK